MESSGTEMTESGSLGPIIDHLKGPQPVVAFQNFCGLRRKPSGDCKEGESQISVGKKWLHYLFLFGTSLGDEAFYSVFFTFWFWSIDGAVGRRVVAVWAICMYIGQSLKDIIRWPRPASPPVIKLERKWELEYGMPSTHAIVGAAVPLSILIFTSSRYVYSFEIGVAIAVSICALVCSSRIYLGMHSVLDIIAGLALVMTLLPVVIPVVDSLDIFFLTHEMGGISLVALGIFMCLCYPSGDRWTPARGDTFVIVGSAVGLNLGHWMNFQLDIIRGPPSNPPYAIMWPTITMTILIVVRQCLGLFVVLLSKSVAKKLVIFVQTRLQLLQHKPSMITELFTKFFTYLVVGFTVTHIAPNIFRLLQIERPTFHTEI